MSAANLTAKYRPRTFAEVAGQDAVKTILSRAAALDRVAPAYLFSGTRGVGKTTIARIFAKALNCAKAPTAEPCNECVHCRQIAAGVAPDVIEIDGASNRGIDDARRLKEDIGYAPIECRYKVFIIDEAHMLTREAFNALLKTLEEPPPRVTFILATTEAHKFPATILSRCQHYSFKMLPQPELAAHLEKILGLEGIPYEPGAVQIIARRGAGSVRDSMSLLGQALAFGGERLVEDEVRGFLGLAGQDVFFALMEAIQARDLPGLSAQLRRILDQGLDLGFFLRELAGCWRNMFLLRQAGEAALPVIDLSAEAARAWLDWAQRFEPAHIHAAWQMTLEAQRRVLTSLEPALALELLLLNLASLPGLVNLESLAPAGGASVSGLSSGPGPAPSAPASGRSGPVAAGDGPHGAGHRSASATPAQQAAPQHQAASVARTQAAAVQASSRQEAAPGVPPAAPQPAPQAASPLAEGRAAPAPAATRLQTPAEDRGAAPAPSPAVSPASPGGGTWPEFVEFLVAKNGQVESKVPGLRQLQGRLEGGTLVVHGTTPYLYSRLTDRECLHTLTRFAREFFGPDTAVRLEQPEQASRKSPEELRREALEHPAVREVITAFQAKYLGIDPRRPG